jgi:hypothetical protein
MAGHPITMLGTVTDSENLTISDGYDVLIDVETTSMVEAWQKTLDMTGGVA